MEDPRGTIRRIVSYIGPGFLVTVGFIDPAERLARERGAGRHRARDSLPERTAGVSAVRREVLGYGDKLGYNTLAPGSGRMDLPHRRLLPVDEGSSPVCSTKQPKTKILSVESPPQDAEAVRLASLAVKIGGVCHRMLYSKASKLRDQRTTETLKSHTGNSGYL